MRRLLAVTTLAILLGVARGGGRGFAGDPLAYATLTRHPSNPVLTLGAGGAWDDNMIAGQSIFYDPPSHRYVMPYSGSGDGSTFDTGLAYSTDRITWTKEAMNPVFTANATEGSQVAQVIVRQDDGSYILYYQSYGGTDGGSRIYAATSPDLTGGGTWTRANGGAAIFVPGTSGEWDDDAVFDPHPVLENGVTQMLYGGQKSDLTRGIGRATAPDGLTFTRQGRLFTPAAGESDVSFGAPAVVGNITSGRYSVFHDAATTGANQVRFICRNDTTDGVTFTHVHQVLTGSGSGWDEIQVFDSTPIVVAGTLYMFYAGAATSGGGVGLASEVGLATMRWR